MDAKCRGAAVSCDFVSNGVGHSTWGPRGYSPRLHGSTVGSYAANGREIDTSGILSHMISVGDARIALLPVLDLIELMSRYSI